MYEAWSCTDGNSVLVVALTIVEMLSKYTVLNGG